jgi:hypothetical protein
VGRQQGIAIFFADLLDDCVAVLFCESAAELDCGKRRMEADTKAERAFCT